MCTPRAHGQFRRGAELSKPWSLRRSACGDGESACKRDSVAPHDAGDHPSDAAYPRVPPVARWRTSRPSLCLALLRVGLTEPYGSLRTLVRSYRTVSPSPVTEPCRHGPAHRRSALCCTVRQVAPTWLTPALCSVESRLSSTRSTPRRGHPTDSPSRPGYVGADDPACVTAFGPPRAHRRDTAGRARPPTDYAGQAVMYS